MARIAAWSSRSVLRAALAVAPVICFGVALLGAERVRLQSNFVPGESLRYRIESRTTTTGTTTTPIANPEGGSKSQQNVHLVIRLDVLPNEPTTNAANAPSSLSAPKALRFRATYEESQIDVDSDALDLAAVSLEDSYRRIEGHSIEFTIGPDGRVGTIQGLDTIFPNPSNAGLVLAWLDGLLSPLHVPQEGIAVGQKWSSERPLAGAALAGLTWRTESSYLRDDLCTVPVIPASPANVSANQASSCAVILTHFRIFRGGSPHSDATPPEYRQNGLRTSGTWTGSGDGLESISLASGLLVTSTETSTQDMDYEVRSATSGSAIHRQSHVQTQSETSLVPAS